MMRINLTAPINDLSYGLVSINLMNALVVDGHEVALFPIGPIHAEQRFHSVIQDAINSSHNPDFDAPSLRLYHQFSMGQHIGRGPKWGLPIFELNRFNSLELNHLGWLDGLIVCSDWAKDIVLHQLPKLKTVVVPLGVDRTIFNESLVHPYSPDSKFIFFNCGKWEYRKGHDILATAFLEAFPDDPNVALMMMCDSGFPQCKSPEWQRYYKELLGDRFIFVPRVATQNELARVMGGVHCGVFPSRAEGWNLPLLECMSLGLPTICTNYSGHTQFANWTNSKLIDIDVMESADDGEWFHGHGDWSHLGENQIRQLVNHMRFVRNNYETNIAGIETAEKFTWQQMAKQVVSALS